ncbi:MAG: tetratricopeptide repeat protein, partial [Gemmata sp.]
MYSRTLAFAGLFLALLGVGSAAHQPPKPADKPAVPEGEIDAVGKQAAALETQLAKVAASSKEGAELQLKLIDLYHESGRPFGLVRTGQSFVGLHTAHARHKEAMLKLIDGLRATGRNKELIATGRQFLARHPNDPACAEIENWLARLLRKTNDSVATAVVQEAHWKRLGATPEGQRAGRDAIGLYFAVNTPDSLAKAAALGEEMLDKLPAGGPATGAGWVAIEAHERASQWAKANAVATKMLAKSPPTTPYHLQYLHARAAENYARLGQRVNAVESWRKAIAVAGMPPRPDLHMRLIEELYQTNPKPAEFEPTVNDYLTKYPTRADRYAAQTRLASVYLTNKDTAKAEQLLAGVLPFDARSHSAASVYAQLFGNDADKTVKANRLAGAEKVMRDAIAKSAPANAAALRYSLALEVLRDRSQNIPAAKAVAREVAYQAPANDGNTGGAVNWLLDSAADDNEFNAELAQVVAARQKFPWVTTYRATLANWAQAKLANKDLAKRAQAANAALAASNKEPVNAEWNAYETAAAANVWSAQSAAARAKLLADPARVSAYPDAVASDLLYLQQYYTRNYSPAPANSVAAAKAWVTRMPQSYDAAAAYLQYATDYAKPDAYREAATGLLKLEPTGTSTEAARRLFTVAGHFKDNATATQAWAWTKKMFDKFGYDNSHAAAMGDALAALNMKAEAKECWERGMTGSPDTQDYYQCAQRLIALLPDAEKPKYTDTLLAKDSGWHFSFAVTRADYLVKANDIAGAAKLLLPAANKVRDRAFGGQAPENDWSALSGWVGAYRTWTPPAVDPKADPNAPKPPAITPADKRALYTLVRDLNVGRASMVARAALTELDDGGKEAPMKRLLALADATVYGYGDATDFDLLTPYVQAAMGRKDYMSAATLMSGMLGHFPGLDEGRRKSGRDLLTQAYTRLGAAGGAVIDEKSPIAPLLAAALQLRLGDQKLAFETYLANQKLFDEHRAEVPVDLLLFVSESHIAAGGDPNHTRVEDTLRAWLIKNTDSKEFDDTEKARVQLLLGRNYFKAKRYDLARAEFTTLMNKYAKTALAVEADFGIGETFMEQKVFDQAEQVFERLAGSRDRDVVIRAEFLRGVLASRRGDRD